LGNLRVYSELGTSARCVCLFRKGHQENRWVTYLLEKEVRKLGFVYFSVAGAEVKKLQE
jgi:hypothetical protein